MVAWQIHRQLRVSAAPLCKRLAMDGFLCAACTETNAAEVLLWVSKFSSRIWRGTLSHDAWTKVANGEGAWRPRKKKQASADRASKDAVLSGESQTN